MTTIALSITIASSSRQGSKKMTATATRRLVNSIIGNHFGDSVQYVVDVLLLKGDLTLSGLVHSTNLLSGKMVREALFVLIQHSLVSYTTTAVASGSSFNSTIYHLELDSIIARVAYGQVVARVAQKFTVKAADLLLDVMVAGRLNTRELKTEEDRVALRILMTDGFLEIVEVAQVGDEAVTSVKRKFTQETTEESFVRFRGPSVVFKMILADKLVEMVTKKLNACAGQIVETIIFGLEDDPSSSSSSSEGLINFSVLQLSQKLPKDLKFPLANDHYHQQQQQPQLKSPLIQYLQVLAQNFDFIHAQTSLGCNAFSLNLKKAMRYLRLVLMESFIRARFGLASARIFKILQTKKMFEERQIAKVAMITSKEVRERLYALMKFGLVHLQEVPKSADHAPSRTIFLWSISERANYANPHKSAIFRTFASKFISTLVNLRDLTVLERRKHAQLLEKVDRSDVSNNLDLLSSTEQKQLADLKRILKVLNVKIDQIFKEFIIFKN